MLTRLYRLLTHLLPGDLQDEFGQDMVQLLQDRLREVRGSRWAAFRLWAAAAADVVWQAGGEWASRGARDTRSIMTEMTTMDGWMKDLGFGIRTLSRRPGFTLAAVVTLALGIGATVSIFTVVNGVLLRPLPYPDSDDLFEVRTVDTERGTRGDGVDHPDVRAWQERIEGIRIAGYAGTRPTLTGIGEPEVIYGVEVTNGLMDVTGVEPALGRDLRASDDVPDGPRLVVVSNRFWTERLGRDPDVLGRSITLGGEPWEIVGVAPAGFHFPDGAELWLPRRHRVEECGHGCRFLRTIGRLEDGLSLEAAEARFAALSEGMAEDFPDTHRYETTELERLIDVEVGDVKVGLWVLLGAVSMVLLIACANVANLMLARAGGRRGEMALRATLGAGRTRIVRQLLTESTLLAGVAGLLGLGLAVWGTGVLVSMAPDALPRLDEVTVSGTVVAFTGLVVLAVTGLFGILPARQLSTVSLSQELGSDRRTTGDHRTGAFRSLLLAGEVALSLSLLLGAGLLLRTLSEARAVELGYETAGIERFRLSIPDSRYDSLGVPRFFEQLERELEALPQVEAAGLGFGIPLASGSINTSFTFLDRPEPPPEDRTSMALRLVSPGYLDASGTALARGRWFAFDDRRSSQPVAVINRAAAALHFPDSDPIGVQVAMDVSWGFDDDPVRTIVGIVGDVRSSSPTEEPEPAVYVPNAQFAANSGYAILKLAPGVASAMTEAREVLARLDPDLAITNVHRVEDVLRAELAATRFYLTLLSVFSVLAIVLAAVGLYGVVAFLVTRRTREIGIRIALGASSDDVVRMIMRQGARPALLGMVVGLAASLLGADVLGSLLYGVSPQDPVTVVAVTAILGGVVVAATILPAGRASRIPPATALREE